MALVLGHVPFDIFEVSLKDKPQSMLDISPKGTVPVLHLIDGTVIEESLDIVKYACGDDFDHALIAENDGKFKYALDRYKYPNRYPHTDYSDARDVCEAFFKKLDAVVDIDSQTLTDICILPFVRQCANVNRDWFDKLPFKNLQQWLAFNVDSELFQVIFDKNFKGF